MSFYWFDSGSRAHRPHSAEPDKTAPQPEKKKKSPYQSPPLERKQAINASQIMRAPVRTLIPQQSFEEARQFFQQSRFRHVPIVNAEGSLVGVLSDRDVLREAVRMAGTPELWIQELIPQSKTIAEFMTKRVLTATPGAEIRQIAKAMFEERIGSMPIVNEDRKLVGIITRSDILRTLVSHAPLELWI